MTALIYPCDPGRGRHGDVTYLVTYAMPQFAKLYQDLDVPLPAITQILLDVAVPLRNYFLIVLAVGGGAGCRVFCGPGRTRARWRSIA